MSGDLRQAWERPSRPRPIVLVGAGGIVNDAHLPAYRRLSLPVVAVLDPNAARARATAERWGIERVLASLDEAAAIPDAIFDVAVPPGALRGVVLSLPEGSFALLQKPMGVDLADATAILAACRARRINAAMNFQLRFAPNMLALADAVDRGLLGRPVEIDVHVCCRMPWELWPFLASLAHMEIAMHSIHYLDLVRRLFGEPRAVHARTVKHPAASGLASSRTSAILDYGDEVRCSLSVNHHHAHGPKHEVSQVRVEGLEGAAVAVMGVNLDYPRGRPDALEIARAERSGEPGRGWENVPLRGSWFTEAFEGPMCNLQRFAAGEDRALVSPLEDAWRTMALVEACYASDAGGGTAVPRLPDLARSGRRRA